MNNRKMLGSGKNLNNGKRMGCPKQCTTIKRRKILRKQERNMLDLPRDVMLLIFMKLGVLEILLYARHVCSTWRELAKDPLLFRSLEFTDVRKYFRFIEKFEYIAQEAVDRSCGQLVKFSSDNMLTEKILYRVNFSSMNTLKSLQLGPETHVSECDLAQVMRGLSLLEEFELWFAHFPKLAIAEVGRSCPNLTTFRFCQIYNDTSFDDEASAISRNMPQLRFLHWIGSKLTNKGLQTLLDGCPHLEHLDLRHSSGLKVSKNVWKRCVGKIKSVVLPDESSFGWEAVSEHVHYYLVRKRNMKWC